MIRSIHTSIRQPATALALLGLTAAGAVQVFGADAAAAAEAKKPKWETAAGLGVTLTSGNGESVAVMGNVLTQYKAEKNEISAGANAGYGEARPQKTAPGPDPDMEKNSDFLRGFVQYNRLFSERLYGYARADAIHDDISDVNYRLTLSPGAGYYFFKKPEFTLGVEVGPGYVFEEVGGDKNDYASLRLAERLEWKFSKTARLWQRIELLPEVTDFNNFLATFELGVGAALTQKLELTVVLTDNYDNQPGVYAWGEEYEKNDLKLTAGLNYKF